MTQPIFLIELGANFKAYVPDALAAQVYPIRGMLDAGLTVAFSSDAPVVRDDAPLKGVEAAVLRHTEEGECILPEQAITVQEALYAYTGGAAEATSLAAGAGCSLTFFQPASLKPALDQPADSRRASNVSPL